MRNRRLFQHTKRGIELEEVDFAVVKPRFQRISSVADVLSALLFPDLAHSTSILSSPGLRPVFGLIDT